MLIKGELGFVELLIKNRKDVNTEKLQEIKEQLIRGDKYEMMWLDLDKVVKGKIEFHTPPPKFRGYRGGILKYYMAKIKEKYFPAPRVKYTPFIEGFTKGVELSMRLNALSAKMKELI